MEEAIAHGDFSQVHNYLARMLPGRRNRPQRRAAFNQLKAQVSGRVHGMVAAPAAYGSTRRNAGPRVFGPRVPGVIPLHNTELVRTVSGASSFELTTVNIQPGLSSVFQWLGSVANNFQYYRIKRLSFEYRPLTGTTTAGDVIMAFVPDASQDEPVNDFQMLQIKDQVSTNLWKQAVLNVTIPPGGKKLYTRSGGVPNTDIKLYDFGRLFISTGTGGAGISAGRVMMSYDIELLEPKPAVCPSTATRFPATQSSFVQLPRVDLECRIATSDDTIRFRSTSVSGFLIAVAGTWVGANTNTVATSGAQVFRSEGHLDSTTEDFHRMVAVAPTNPDGSEWSVTFTLSGTTVHTDIEVMAADWSPPVEDLA